MLPEEIRCRWWRENGLCPEHFFKAIFEESESRIASYQDEK
jgi:hypothetical protein